MADAPKLMGMFLQDPSLTDLHEDFDFTTTGDFLEGTGSSRFFVLDADPDTGLPHYPSIDWADPRADLSFAAFDAQGLVDNPQFHQVNVFAVLTRALAMVEEELGAPLRWREGGPLVVRPHAFEGMNAYYDPQSPSLNFGWFTSPFRRGPVWTCLSADVVAHEMGHAVLDNFRPLFLHGFEPDVGALHESIGDLVAMFSALSHPPVVERMFAESGGDLRRLSVITRMAEEFGYGLEGGGAAFLRSSLSDLRYDDDAPEEPHARSVIWTAAIYDLLARLVEMTLAGDRTFEAFVAAVVEASRWTRGMLVRAMHSLPPSGVTLPQFAALIVAADERVFPHDAAFRDVARQVFTDRGLWDEGLDLGAPDIGASFTPQAAPDSAALAGAVVRHADALHIPLGLGARMLTPQRVTTTRRVDKVKDAEGVGHLTTIVERHLSYAYELVVRMTFDIPGQGPVTFGVPLTFGGTLVMDEDWNALLLCTQPAITADDAKADDPLLRALGRAVQRIRDVIGRRLGEPGAELHLSDPADGPVRVERRACRLGDHLRGISGQDATFPFATRGRASAR